MIFTDLMYLNFLTFSSKALSYRHHIWIYFNILNFQKTTDSCWKNFGTILILRIFGLHTVPVPLKNDFAWMGKFKVTSSFFVLFFNYFQNKKGRPSKISCLCFIKSTI
jgi:hypothetical protein